MSRSHHPLPCAKRWPCACGPTEVAVVDRESCYAWRDSDAVYTPYLTFLQYYYRKGSAIRYVV